MLSTPLFSSDISTIGIGLEEAENEVNSNDVNTNIIKNYPDWQINPDGYEFSSYMIALVLMDSLSIIDDGDMMAGFDKNGNICGLANQLINISFGPYAGNTLYEIMIYSNSGSNIISFQYYDSSQDTIYNILEKYVFIDEDIYGDLIKPQVLNIHTWLDISIDVNKGWNWISINVADDDMTLSNVFSSFDQVNNGDVIYSQISIAEYFEEYGWYGSLENIDINTMYKLYISNTQTLEFRGLPLFPPTTAIDLQYGWNWIGYTPQVIHSVNSALSGISNNLLYNGTSIISSQNEGFAIYYGEQLGWYGNLHYLEPGQGYKLLIQDSGEFFYPDNKLVYTRMLVEKNIPNTISDWNINPYSYEFIRFLTASFDNQIDAEGDFVGAFIDDECRGIAQRMFAPFNQKYIYMIQLYSNNIDGDNINFKYYSSSNDKVSTLPQSIEFIPNALIGNAMNPFLLGQQLANESLPITTSIYNLYSAYPNPFNPTSTISFSIPIFGYTTITAYDITGKKLETLTNTNLNPGNYSIDWNASSYPSGVYLIKMDSGDFTQTQKVVLVK